MQKIKVFLISIVVIFVIAAAGVSGQSMQIIDDLLATENAEFGDSVYMIAIGSGLADDSATVSEAVELINKKGWNVSNKTAEHAITLGELSFVIMQALDVEGGIMYGLLPSPRYAVRELNYLGLIDGEAHPGNPVSGSDVIKILSGALEIKEAR